MLKCCKTAIPSKQAEASAVIRQNLLQRQKLYSLNKAKVIILPNEITDLVPIMDAIFFLFTMISSEIFEFEYYIIVVPFMIFKLYIHLDSAFDNCTLFLSLYCRAMELGLNVCMEKTLLCFQNSKR